MKLQLGSIVVIWLLASSSLMAGDVSVPATGESPGIAQCLKEMSPEQKANADISIILPPHSGSAAVELKEHVETLWNSGEYDPAIVEIAGLAGLCGGREPQVEAIWRIPETSESPDRWSGDIRIGATVEHAYVVDMAVDPQTGNIFCGIVYVNGSNYALAIYFSDDGGSTWSSPNTYYGPGYVHDVSLTIAGDYCYFATDSDDQAVRIYRRVAATGAIATFPGGESSIYALFLDYPQAVSELEIRSDYELGGPGEGFMLVVGTSSPADLLIYRGWNQGVSWSKTSEFSNSGSSVRGVDLCANEGWSASTYPFYVSFIDGENWLRIGGIGALDLDWHQLYLLNVYPNADRTTIGAYDNNVYCAYEYNDYWGTGRTWCRRIASDDGGMTWAGNALSGSNSDDTFSPDVCLAGGSGQGIVYSHNMFTATRIYFFWQPYGSFAYPNEISFGSETPGNPKPDIEHLGGGEYGVVYVRYDYPIGGVYFDRGTDCCDGVRGDVDGSGAVNVSDLTYLVAYLFQGGDQPRCIAEGDVDGSGATNVSDLTYLVAYLFQGGPVSPACP